MKSTARCLVRENSLMSGYWQTALNWGEKLPEFRKRTGEYKVAAEKDQAATPSTKR